MRRVSLAVNGVRHELDLEPRELLVYVLRERLGLTGTNVGCDTSSCGACTVLVDGESVKSCTVLGVQADGVEVTTIEGLADERRAAPGPAGVPRAPRAPVRLLHAGDGAGGRRASSRRTRSRARTRSGTGSRATSAAAPATRTSSRPCRRGGGGVGRGRWHHRDRQQHVVGTPVPRKEDPSSSPARPVRRRHRLPGMVWMAVVRSPYAHARIKRRRPDGGARGRGRRRGVLRRRPRRRVGGRAAVRLARHRGHQDAAALAARHRQGALRRRRRRGRRRRDARAREGRGRARRGRLRAAACGHATSRRRSTTARRSCTTSSARTTATRGSSRPARPSRLFAEAAVTVKERYRQQRLIPNAIEPRGVDRAADRRARASSRCGRRRRSRTSCGVTLAGVVGIPEAKLRVIAPDVGGGFGSKLNVYAEEALCLALARRLGRPSSGSRSARRATSRRSTAATSSRRSSSRRPPRARSPRSGCG